MGPTASHRTGTTPSSSEAHAMRHDISNNVIRLPHATRAEADETDPPWHPMAEIFPMMDGPELDRLAADIKAHGLREPVWVDGQGRILDGRNRARACRLAGVPLESRVYENDDALAFVVSRNLHRRHLGESQRAMIAARLANIRRGDVGRGRDKIDGSIELPKAASLLNVGNASVKRARTVADHGAPAVVSAVDSGLITVADAASVADLPPAEQEALVAEVRSGKHKTLRRAAVARRRAAREMPPPDLPADARCRLFVADVAGMADRLAPGSVDCIVTDPPYPRQFLPVYADLARTAAHVLKPGGSCLVMVGQSYLPEIIAAMTPHLRYHWTVAYLTPGGQATQLWDRKVNTFWKPVLWFVNGDHAGDWVGDVVRSSPNDNDKRFHHWGQSESGMADLLRRFTAAGQTILDPFLGGGTTGVVALDLGRMFVGADIDGKAVETAQARLATLARETAHAG
jgi:site-specific DNA-methyltransferase (adenine-specific)